MLISKWKDGFTNTNLKIYASLSADIVDSTSLSVRDLKCLREEIYKTLEHLDETITPVWGRVVRGDTIECITSIPASILRIALVLKCFLKYWFSTIDALLMRGYIHLDIQ